MPRKDFRQAKAEKKAKKAAKNKHRKGPPSREFRPSPALLSGLDEAEQLLDEGSIEEAVEILEELARRYPRRLEVLGMLLDAYYQLHDMWSYQSVCQRFTELDPNSAEAWLSLAGVTVGNSQMATAYQAFDHFLSRWPDHSEAAYARKVCAGLEEILSEEAAKYGLSSQDGLSTLLLHDEINFHLHQGEYAQVLNTAKR